MEKTKPQPTNFTKALAADPQLYRSRFYKAMLSAENSNTAGRRPKRPSDRHVWRDQRQPRFAPAYVELAFAVACRGDLKDGLLVAQKAESLEPHRAGYHTLTARILVAMGGNDEAIKEISFVAERFGGPDDDEAEAMEPHSP